MNISWIDWMIVLIPVAFVWGMGWYSRRYARGVSDFLSAGRLCGRYVISVGDIANGLSIIGLMSFIEIHYKTGFALEFWKQLTLPLSIFIGLTGFFTYRFRETKAMSLGQFLEMRYSRKFRIFASGLRSLSEIIANSIMPAIGARFFIYFLDLPETFNFLGLQLSTFMILMLTLHWGQWMLIAFAVIIPRWFEQKRGLAIGLTFMGSGLGGMLFNTLAGDWVVTLGPVQTYQILAAVTGCVLIPLVFFVIRTAPGNAQESSPAAQSVPVPAEGLTLQEALRRKPPRCRLPLPRRQTV